MSQTQQPNENQQSPKKVGALEGAVAIVTGGASGMGRATVERFLDEGASVVVGDLNVESGTRLVEDLASHGARLRFTRTDVTDENDIAALVDLAVGSFGHLDVMFNNAGVGGAFGPITEITLEDWRRTFDILVASVFLGTKYAARQMISQGSGGSIVNTASVAGLSGGGGPQAYSASKAAVINLSATTAVELAPHKIRVNAICPGIIYTPLMHGADPQGIASADEMIAELQPLPQRGEGSDIAAAALWLASDESRFFTGQTLTLDGGLVAAGTRIHGRLHNTRNLHRIAGIAYGSTGLPAEARRLD